jgi:hypothetical protein
MTAWLCSTEPSIRLLCTGSRLTVPASFPHLVNNFQLLIRLIHSAQLTVRFFTYRSVPMLTTPNETGA